MPIYFRQRPSNLLKTDSQTLRQACASVCRRNCSAGSVEQPYSQTGLQISNGMTERGRGDTQFNGSLGEAAMTLHRKKGIQIG